MLVREVMTAPALSVTSDADLDAALSLMAAKKITALPVTDSEGHLVGIVSEIDLLRRAVAPDHRAHALPVNESPPLPRTVGEIMTKSPRCTTERADVADLVRLFTTSSFKSLPVVRDGKLIGVISRSDVIRALWRSDEDLLADLRLAFHEYGQDRWQLSVSQGIVEITGAGSARERDIASAIAHSVIGVRRVNVSVPDSADGE